jgi:hypothetical protein
MARIIEKSTDEGNLVPQKSIGEMDCSLNVIRWPMWRKNVIGTLVIPLRKRVLRVAECMMFEIAVFQFTAETISTPMI